MRNLVRQHLRFFLIAAAAGIALRLIFIFFFSRITGDSFIYGDIAKNWLLHGIYGVSGEDISPTYIRLPGYPAFLALIFSIFGVEHYRAALFVQMFFDLGSCFLIADLARRLASPRAAKAAFLLAAICPCLANYVAAALTETLEVFFSALALDLAVIGLNEYTQARTRVWLGCGLAIAGAILLRPDGGLLLISVGLYLVFALVRSWNNQGQARYWLQAILIVGLTSVAPLIPWTIRNLLTMHRFQPLAPRYANEEDEFVPMGFNRWVKTWIADYVSTEEIYWEVPGDTIDISKLPNRAFDNGEQQKQTEALFDEYNASLHVTPDLDARFAELAQQRIHHSPVRYYLWLPALRIADMWLRPRTEALGSNSRWWEFDDAPLGMTMAIIVGAANLAYVALALAGSLRVKFGPPIALLVGFVLLRSVFLGSLENPETRYTLECYPVVIVLASGYIAKFGYLK